MTESAAGVRRRSVRRSVLIADRIADQTIRIGGILVIVAVLGILVFLVVLFFLMTIVRMGEQVGPVQ